MEGEVRGGWLVEKAARAMLRNVVYRAYCVTDTYVQCHQLMLTILQWIEWLPCSTVATHKGQNSDPSHHFDFVIDEFTSNLLNPVGRQIATGSHT